MATNHLMVINARVVTPFRILERGFVEVADTKILSVGSMADLETGSGTPDGVKVIDAAGRVVVPGFIDLHSHGGGGADLMDATPEAVLRMAEAHARGGTTSLLPTTLTSSDDELRATLKAYRSAVQKAAAARPGERTTCNLIGLHLEGQYFSPTQAGAQDPRYLKSPVPSDYLPLLDEFPEIRRWSAAPELPGALEFGSVLRSRGVVASIAHTDTDYDTVVRALESGFTHLTHFYLGMSTIRRVNCFRVPGVIEAGYLMDELTIELLADGFHIPTTLLRLAHKIKGADHVALVTDGNRAVGMPDGEYLLGSLADGQPFIKENGGSWMRGRTAFAAGVVTFNMLVKTIVEGAGIPLPDACRMASTTPARIMGLAGKGVLAPGRDADLVILEPDFEVALTMAEGQIVYREESLA